MIEINTFLQELMLWLYSVGESIVTISKQLIELVNTPIWLGFNEYTIWELMVTLFITVYVPYAIIKWVI